MVYKQKGSENWWYKFTFAGRPIRESAKTKSKELARTAQTVAETIGTDNGGSYTTITGPASLAAVEATIPIAAGSNAYISAATGTATGFVVTATSTTNSTYTITRAANGTVSRTCAPASTGGCSAGLTW